MSHDHENLSSMVSTRSDTNQPLQPQKLGTVLDFTDTDTAEITVCEKQTAKGADQCAWKLFVFLEFT